MDFLSLLGACNLTSADCPILGVRNSQKIIMIRRRANQTGSYAITIFSQSFVRSDTALSWDSTTSIVLFPSRCLYPISSRYQCPLLWRHTSRVSPTQRITFRPASRATFVLLATNYMTQIWSALPQEKCVWS